MLAWGALLPLVVAAAEAPPRPVPIKTGNLSVNLIMAAARGQPRPEWRPEMDFAALRDQVGLRGVEDYLCWLPLEPERDQWRWEFYLRNCEALEQAGLEYAVYPWLHFAPAWVPGSELWEPSVQLGSGRTTWAPSIWSPRTLAIFDRFYARLHQTFGDRVKQIYVSMVCDYGEVGYPIGMADWVVPAEFKGPGFWCGDPLARADFQAKMLAQHGDRAALNRAWGTAFAADEAIDYPPWTATEGPAFAELAALPPTERGQARRRWLDFVAWYFEAMVEFTGRAVAVSRRYYPNTPHEVKIGFGSERVMFGADYTHYLARSRADGYTVRSTHGKLPPFFYRRFSTAARHYGVPLVTEPPSDVSRDEEVERIFKDATSGTTEYFDYPANLLGAADLFQRYGAYLEGRHAEADLAFFFPTTDHRLRPAQSQPVRLWDVCLESRDLLEFDVLDERLIADGALDRYRALAIVEGSVIEAATIARLRAWQQAGGLLLAVDYGPIETVEGDLAPGAELLQNAVRIPNGERVQVADALAAALSAHGQRLVDGRRDGVWTARLPNRVLLYNSAREPRTVTVDGTRVELPPIALGSIELPSREVRVP